MGRKKQEEGVAGHSKRDFDITSTILTCSSLPKWRDVIAVWILFGNPQQIASCVSTPEDVDVDPNTSSSVVSKRDRQSGNQVFYHYFFLGIYVNFFC